MKHYYPRASTIAALLTLPLLIPTLGCASTTPQAGAYRTSLDQLDTLDQLLRSAITWKTVDTDELAELNALDNEANMLEYTRRAKEGLELDPTLDTYLRAKQNIIDQTVSSMLMDLIEEHGWPTVETAGEGFPSPVPILIHMPMEEMERILPILREEVLAGRMPPSPYASIYDRKQQHDLKPQLYGKVVNFDYETQSTLPPAIVDIDATNRARAEIGMEPLADYRITDAKTAAGQ